MDRADGSVRTILSGREALALEEGAAEEPGPAGRGTADDAALEGSQFRSRRGSERLKTEGIGVLDLDLLDLDLGPRVQIPSRDKTPESRRL